MEMPSATTSTTTAKLHHSRRKTISGDIDKQLLEPEDFNDVFGGPPLTMSRQYHGGYNNFLRSSFYEEIFRPPVKLGPEGTVQGNGRVLQEFNIPKRSGGRKSDQRFFSNIFGWGKEEVRRLRTRSGSGSGSKSKESSPSASVLSSEDLSPVQRAVGGGFRGGDDEVPLFASTLRIRSLNVPRRRNSVGTVHEEHRRQQDMPTFSWNHHPFYNAENENYENIRSSHFGYCPRNSSPEPNSYRNLKVSGDDLEPNSFSSAVSSIGQDQETIASKIRDEMMQDQGVENDEDEDEIMNSYVIEINSENREGTDDATGVEEAIAWAKEMFQKHSSENSWSTKVNEEKQSAEAEEMVKGDQSLEEQKMDEHGSTETAMLEMEQLDENVRLWSTGKEADIRLLLSTLHHILWRNSGWLAISITSLRESSQVKKAYQKARLCLHPDKLQQRGATLRQTHIAERVFFILQEAWPTFISTCVS